MVLSWKEAGAMAVAWSAASLADVRRPARYGICGMYACTNETRRT